MSYLALYRKYRPRTFKDVFGQEHIKTTLENAVANKKVAHAYLFSGPRGTGKTSIAKIMGMSLNCLAEGGLKPCLECENCNATLNGINTDIIEIDAASNNGVDEIRDLKEKVKFAATYGGYKVYIIDEVHMLSTGAFNALLKTLEEPPKHVIFILATTEPHKIPPTIISRCQRFDFKSIDEKVIKSRLLEVLEKESIKYEDAAIDFVVKAAEGGMRDALSILDQVIAYSDNQIETKSVLEVLGTVSYETLGELISNLNSNDTFEAITKLDEILKSGKDIKQLISTLLNMYRDILFIQSMGEGAKSFVLDYNTALGLAKKTSLNTAQHAVLLLNTGLNEIKFSLQPRTYLEVILIKIGMGESEPKENSNLDTNKLERLEAEINDLKLMINNIKLEKVTPEVKPHKKEFIAPPTNTASNLISENEVYEILDLADKNLRKNLNQRWESLIKECELNFPNLKALMHGSKLVAANNGMLLLTCGIKPQVNLLMQEANYNNVKSLLYKVFAIDFEYKVIDEVTWDKYKKEYIKFLEKRKNNSLNVDSPQANQEKSLEDKLVDTFGREKVVVEN